MATILDGQAEEADLTPTKSAEAVLLGACWVEAALLGACWVEAVLLGVTGRSGASLCHGSKRRFSVRMSSTTFTEPRGP
ncbi:MAG: hypothetical protein AAGC53_19225, partial [Actinomycetota bacterium]